MPEKPSLQWIIRDFHITIQSPTIKRFVLILRQILFDKTPAFLLRIWNFHKSWFVGKDKTTKPNIKE